MADDPQALATAIAQTRRIQALSVEDREAAIAAADNIIGAERFLQRKRQVDMRHEYRRTFDGKRP